MNLSPHTSRSPKQESRFYLGQAEPVNSWLSHMNGIFYQLAGEGLHSHFVTHVSHCLRTSFALANNFHEHLRNLGHNVPNEIVAHEYGIGNGNFSSGVVYQMQQLDAQFGTDFFKRLVVVLCDSSLKVLESARNHPMIRHYKNSFVFAHVDARNIEAPEPHLIIAGRGDFGDLSRFFRERSVHKIYSNELGDTLPAKEFAVDRGMLIETLICPYLPEACFANKPFSKEEFRAAYLESNLERLMQWDTLSILKEIELAYQFDISPIKQTLDGLNSSHFPNLIQLARHCAQVSQGRTFNYNYGIYQHLECALKLLDPQNGAGYDFFDMGPQTLDDISSFEGTQVIASNADFCTTVNGPLAALTAREIGFEPVIQSHRDFVNQGLKLQTIQIRDLLATHQRMSGLSDLQLLEALKGRAPDIDLNSLGRTAIDILNPYYAPAGIRRQLPLINVHQFVTRTEVESAYGELRKQGFDTAIIAKLFSEPVKGPSKQFFHLGLKATL